MDKKKFLFIGLVCGMLFIVNIIGFAEDDVEKKGMRIEFYKLNKETYTKGEFLGIAEIKGKDFVINVNDVDFDKFLRKILSEPYKRLVGEMEGKVAIEKEVILEPGTPEHIQAVIEECWKEYRIIGEIVAENN